VGGVLRQAGVRFDPLAEHVVDLGHAERLPRRRRVHPQTARATALIDGRAYVVPEDVLDNVLPVCAHRLIVRGSSEQTDSHEAEAVLEQILQTVEAPS